MAVVTYAHNAGQFQDCAKFVLRVQPNNGKMLQTTDTTQKVASPCQKGTCDANTCRLESFVFLPRRIPFSPLPTALCKLLPVNHLQRAVLFCALQYSVLCGHYVEFRTDLFRNLTLNDNDEAIPVRRLA